MFKSRNKPLAVIPSFSNTLPMFPKVIPLLLLLATLAFSQQSDNKPAEPLRVSQGVEMGLLLHRFEPEYPKLAREYHLEGRVMLHLVIDQEGNTTDVSVIEGHPMLYEAAIAAAKQYKFKPYLLNDKPIPVQTTAVIPFYLKPPNFPGKAESQEKLRVSEGKMNASVLHRVEPDYPVVAKIRHIQGDVILGATIDREGRIADINPLNGNPALVESSVSAVKQWQFRPFMLNGQPVDVITIIKVSYHL